MRFLRLMPRCSCSLVTAVGKLVFRFDLLLKDVKKKKKKKDVKCLDKDGGYATKYPTFE